MNIITACSTQVGRAGSGRAAQSYKDLNFPTSAEPPSSRGNSLGGTERRRTLLALVFYVEGLLCLRAVPLRPPHLMHVRSYVNIWTHMCSSEKLTYVCKFYVVIYATSIITYWYYKYIYMSIYNTSWVVCATSWLHAGGPPSLTPLPLYSSAAQEPSPPHYVWGGTVLGLAS